jgi:predicted membrane GTPase involved in stress response
VECPQALALRKTVMVVVNKIDRPSARPDWVVDTTFELFMDLGADDEQCDFRTVFASGVNGIAGHSATELASDLTPLFDAIIETVRCAAAVPYGRCCCLAGAAGALWRSAELVGELACIGSLSQPDT